MIRDLDIDLLRSFVAVAAHRNFTRAGKAIGRTQSAVSLQIKRLEEIAGRPLFERSRHLVEITLTGEALLVYAHRILKLNDEALSHMARPEAAGLVRIGTPDDYATILLPPIIAQLTREYPRIRVEITCENGTDLLRMQARDELDLVMSTHPLNDVAGEVARRESLHWVAAPGYVDDPDAPLSLVLFPQGCVCRDIALQALNGIDRDWHIACSTRSIDLIEKAVISGSGVSVMEVSTIPDTLQIIDGSSGFPPLPGVVIAVHRRDDMAAPHVGLAADFILRHLQRQPDEARLARAG